MASVDGTALTQMTLTIEYDNASYRAERYQMEKAIFHERATYQAKFWRDFSTRWSKNPVPTIVAPKWSRQRDEYTKPQLLKHEKEPIAPRYGGDAIRQQLRPVEEFGCSCRFCTPWGLSHVQQERMEIDRVLRRISPNAGSGRARVGSAGTRSWADWDWNGWDDPYSYDGDDDWLLNYQEEKRAPQLTVDLSSLVRPAKGRKRRSRAQPSCSHMSRAAQSVEPVGTNGGVFSDYDNVSVLKFGETWQHLDPDRLDSGTDYEGRESEWEWECFSQIQQ